MHAPKEADDALLLLLFCEGAVGPRVAKGDEGIKIDFIEELGGGGGSRTRVRNRCQPRVSMRSRVPKTSQRALKTDKMRTPLVR